MLQDLFPRDHGKYQASRFRAELEALADWLRAQAICGTHFGCICTGSGRCSTDVTDSNLEGCSRKRISGKRSLFPVEVPTSISAQAASSPASWLPQDA